MSSPTIGVGVIGLGVGEQHALAFAAHPGCRIVALCDHDPAKLAAVAEKLPGTRTYRRAEDLIDDPDITVVSVASNDDHHYQQVVRALRGGKHVFVEKPVCRTLEELVDIKARWQAANGRLKLHSNLVLQAAPLYLWLRERIQAGEFGQLYAFDGDYLYGRLHKITEGWRGKVADYSVMEGGGVHLVDLLLWLTGERPVTVTASGNRICTAESEFRYSDFVAATLDFKSGLVARVTANFGCVHRHQHVMRIFGTRATFLYDDKGARWYRSRDPAVPADCLKQPPLPATKGDLVPRFVSSVIDDTEDGERTQGIFDDISVCIAADRAVATGKKERIEYV